MYRQIFYYPKATYIVQCHNRIKDTSAIQKKKDQKTAAIQRQ